MKTQYDLTFDRGRQIVRSDLTHVVLIGGMWSIARQFDEMVAFLQENNCLVTVVDHPGHGEDTSDLRKVTIRSCFTKQINVIRQLGHPVVIIGHSLGCQLAIKIAAEHPELVSGVICLAHGTMPEARVPISVLVKAISWQLLWGLTGSVFQFKGRVRDLIRDGTTVPLGPESGKVLWGTLNGVKIPRLTDLGVRAKLIAQENDNIIPLPTSRKIAQYHGLDLTILPGGHFAWYHPLTRRTVWNTVLDILNLWKKK